MPNGLVEVKKPVYAAYEFDGTRKCIDQLCKDLNVKVRYARDDVFSKETPKTVTAVTFHEINRPVHKGNYILVDTLGIEDITVVTVEELELKFERVGDIPVKEEAHPVLPGLDITDIIAEGSKAPVEENKEELVEDEVVANDVTIPDAGTPVVRNNVPPVVKPVVVGG